MKAKMDDDPNILDDEVTPTSGMPLSSSCILSKYRQAIELTGESPEDALRILLDLRSQITALDLVSRNESLLDIQTSSLYLASIQYHIAMAYLATSSTYNKTQRRFENLQKAMGLFHDFLRQMEGIMSYSEGEEGQRLYRASNIHSDYHAFLDKLDEDDDDDSEQRGSWMKAAELTRDEKIARLRRKWQLENDIDTLNSSFQVKGKSREFQEANNEDDEALRRDLYTKQLILYCIVSIEELYACSKEMEILKVAVRIEKEKQQHEMRMQPTPAKGNFANNQLINNNLEMQGLNQTQGKTLTKTPIELTHIAHDPITGKLIFQKEQIQSGVFRPSWNLPTKSLAQLGDQERAAALQRSKQQHIDQKDQQPKRYDQLLAEGLEDDSDLVDASASLDRKWDDFKDENPRGSGNKMGDRGDRNF